MDGLLLPRKGCEVISIPFIEDDVYGQPNLSFRWFEQNSDLTAFEPIDHAKLCLTNYLPICQAWFVVSVTAALVDQEFKEVLAAVVDASPPLPTVAVRRICSPHLDYPRLIDRVFEEQHDVKVHHARYHCVEKVQRYMRLFEQMLVGSFNETARKVLVSTNVFLSTLEYVNSWTNPKSAWKEVFMTHKRLSSTGILAQVADLDKPSDRRGVRDGLEVPLDIVRMIFRPPAHMPLWHKLLHHIDTEEPPVAPPASRPEHFSPSARYQMRVFESHGWCSNVGRNVCKSFGFLFCNYMAALVQSHDHGSKIWDHTPCRNLSTCSLSQVCNEAQYIRKHGERCRDQGSCQEVKVRTEDLCDVIFEGGIPVIVIDLGSKTPTALEVQS